MDLAAIDWRSRLRRRFPFALFGAQLWLTGTWLTTLSRECYRGGTVACPAIGDPGAPVLLAIGGVVGLVVWALALAVPAGWLEALGSAVPTLEALRRTGPRTHLTALGFLALAAVVSPRLFVGQLELTGLAWAVAALPAAPALLLLFGTLSLAMLAGPLVGDLPSFVALVLALFLLLLAAGLQTAFYYGLAAGLGRLVGLARRRLGVAGRAAGGE